MDCIAAGGFDESGNMTMAALKAVPPSDGFDDLALSTDRLPLIPPGEDYEVVCIGCRKTKSFNRSVLAFTFRIVSQCEYIDTILPTLINFPCHGNYVPPRSKVAAWMRIIQVFDPQVTLKGFKVKIFREFMFRASVETVLRDWDKRLLLAHEQFSKVADLKEVIGRLAS